ncbi:MAG: glycosyltransferase family 4 protein [Candidatus Thiodiazotropha sp.]
MRILYIHQYFAMPSTGGATRSYEMARRMVASGHQVTLLTSSAFLPDSMIPHDGWNSLEVEGIQLQVLKLPYSNRLPFWKRILRFVQFLVRVSLRARHWRGDVVFATSTPLTVAIPAVMTARRNRVSMVFEVRDLWPELPIAIGAIKNPALIRMASWLERFAYRNASQVVALSPGMAEGIARSGYPRERIRMIPNGCDMELFDVRQSDCRELLAAYPFLKDHPLVVYTGTFGKINGVGYLVEIAKAMKMIDPGIRFIMAGDGAETELVKSAANDAGLLNETVFILEPLTKYQVACLLEVAKVATSLFVNLPEMWNNSANKFFDALAAGCPLMINYGGWQAALLEESGAGIVVSPNDAVSAAHKLSGFIADSDMRDRSASAARMLAETRFDRDALASELIEVLEQASGVETVDAEG